MQLPQPHKPYSEAKSIGAFEARRKLGQLIEEAYYKQDAFVIERAGRPMAVIISVDQYQKLKHHAHHEVMEMIRDVWKKTDHIPAEELEQDVEKAMQLLRKEHLAQRKQSKSTL